MTFFRSMFVVLVLGFLISASAWSQSSKEKADLLISDGTVVTMDGARTIYVDGSIVVKGDTIIAVGPRSDIEAKYVAAQTIDAKGKLVLPGFINGHTHVPMTLFRGLHDDVTLNDWLYKYIFPAEAKNVNEEFVRWGTRLAAAEQIRGGVTTFADMYYFEDAVAEETKAAGMRGVLGETFIDFPAPDNKSNAEMLAYTERFLKKWQGDPLIHAAVAPHSMYTCSQKTLQDASALARKYHAPILIHVAEMKKERDDSEKQHGMSPVQYLDKVGVLGPDVVAAHCIFVDEADWKTLAQRQVGCVHNPSSNMMLASGVSPVAEMRSAGVAVGLGHRRARGEQQRFGPHGRNGPDRETCEDHSYGSAGDECKSSRGNGNYRRSESTSSRERNRLIGSRKESRSDIDWPRRAQCRSNVRYLRATGLRAKGQRCGVRSYRREGRYA